VTVSHEHRTYGGMLYIGYRPTLLGTKRNIEVNIFDFSEDIYGETLILHFHQKLRDDRTFEGLEPMKAQLLKDKENALAVLSKLEGRS
jgi:riboflavin kinase/FMN adenylyltransferase